MFNSKRYLKPALTEEEVREIKEIFDLFDTERRGLVNPQGT
jgi:Ca2+-binding EF-hand superfamily protein